MAALGSAAPIGDSSFSRIVSTRPVHPPHPGAPWPLTLTRLMKGTKEQEAAKTAVLRQDSATAGREAAGVHTLALTLARHGAADDGPRARRARDLRDDAGRVARLRPRVLHALLRRHGHEDAHGARVARG
eukprot:scaffold106876_cov48-Phaeocystis_antarctica.AAC.1